ncbi:MAG: dephospho-CoA kinase [Actinomycetota bacterium]|nr:dephospho-CoA kinase [Actinomycetota bacterium]
MTLIGLTGGIGVGKSSVASLFSKRGAVVIDADDLAREVVEPGEPGYAAVVERFGPSVVAADGRLDRKALADIVFSDPSARADLEAIVHPAVARLRDRYLAELVRDGSDRVVVVVIPLLVEVGWDGADAVVVVDCAEEVAVRRLVERRGMDEADVRRRLAAQATREQRLARADWVIHNDGTPEDLAAEVDRAWEWITTTIRSGDALTGPDRLIRSRNRGDRSEPAAGARPPDQGGPPTHAM